MFLDRKKRRLNTFSWIWRVLLWTARRHYPALVATVLTVLCYSATRVRFSRRDNDGDTVPRLLSSSQLDSSLLSLITPSSSAAADASSVDISRSVQSQQQQQQEEDIRRVIVVTVWSHYPDLMPLQIASVRAFLQHAQHHPIVEIVAVTNANNYTQRWELDRVAKQLGVHVLPVYDAWKYQDYPSLSHINALNFVMQALLRGLLVPQFPLQNDILFFLDSDMFLMEPVSLVQELNGAALLSPLQTKENKHTYLWPNLSVFSFGEWAMQQEEQQQQQQQQTPYWMERWTKHWFGEDQQMQQKESYKMLYEELNFDACFPECPCDCGGCTKYFMERHPDLMVQNWTNTCSLSAISNTNNNVCQFWNQQTQIELPSQKCTHPQVFGPIYHLGSAGSNWRGCDEDFLRQRRQDLFHQMQKVLPKDIYERHNSVFGYTSAT